MKNSYYQNTNVEYMELQLNYFINTGEKYNLPVCFLFDITHFQKERLFP